MDGNEQNNVFEIVEYLVGSTLAIRGGAGVDIVKLAGQNKGFELSQNSAVSISSVERFDLRNSQPQTLDVALDAIISEPGDISRNLVIVTDSQDLMRFARGRQIQSPVVLDGELTHRMTFNQQFLAIQNQLPWTNPVEPLDIDGDGRVGPLDVLNVINLVNSGRGLELPDKDADLEGWRYYDTDGSGGVDPLDVLRIINAINAAR